MSPWYKLDENKRPVPCDVQDWDTADRKVDLTEVRPGVLVSTVFLGLDHGFGGAPQWFETMVFRDGHGVEQERCETWEQAVDMHAEMVKRVTS